MFVLLTCDAAGYEIVYDVLNHIVGRSRKFSGIPIHLGHFRAHVEEQIKMKNAEVRGFFSPLKWTMFIQSAMAARLKGLPATVREPCCALKVIGGDGTAIGVTLANMDSVCPVWEPPGGLRPRIKNWGCMDRCAIGISSTDSTASERDDARTYLKSSTEFSASSDAYANAREMLDQMKDSIPKEIFDVLEMWFSSDLMCDQWEPVRKILRACSYKDSVCGIVNQSMIPHVLAAIALMCLPHPFSKKQDLDKWDNCMEGLKNKCLGNEIANVCHSLKQQYLSTPSTRKHLLVFASLLQYLGKVILLIVTCIHILMHRINNHKFILFCV